MTCQLFSVEKASQNGRWSAISCLSFFLNLVNLVNPVEDMSCDLRDRILESEPLTIFT